MKFMVIVKASKDSEAGVMPSAELLMAMGQYNEELSKAGVLVAGEGLHPSSEGRARPFLGREPHGDRRTLRRNEGIDRRLLDSRGGVARALHRMGEEVAQSASRRGRDGDRDPADLRA